MVISSYPLASQPSKRNLTSFCDIDTDTLLMFGGWTSYETETNETWLFHKTTETWEQLNPVTKPSARMGSPMCKISSTEFLIFGGYTGTGANDVWVFDSSTNEWSLRATTNTPPVSWGHAIECSNNKVYLYGVSTGVYTNTNTYVLDLTTNAWSATTLSPTPPLRSYGVMKTLDDGNIILHGDSTGNNASTWLLNTTSFTWSDISTPNDSVAKMASIIRLRSGDLVGVCTYNSSQSLKIFNQSTLRWGKIYNNHIIPGYSPTITELDDNTIYLVGSFNGYDYSTIDIYAYEYVGIIIPEIDVEYSEESLFSNVIASSFDIDVDPFTCSMTITDQHGVPVVDVGCVMYYDSYKYSSRTDVNGYVGLYHWVGNPNTLTISKLGYKPTTKVFTTNENNNPSLILSITLEKLYTPLLNRNNRLELFRPNTLNTKLFEFDYTRGIETLSNSLSLQQTSFYKYKDIALNSYGGGCLLSDCGITKGSSQYAYSTKYFIKRVVLEGDFTIRLKLRYQASSNASIFNFVSVGDSRGYTFTNTSLSVVNNGVPSTILTLTLIDNTLYDIMFIKRNGSYYALLDNVLVAYNNTPAQLTDIMESYRLELFSFRNADPSASEIKYFAFSAGGLDLSDYTIGDYIQTEPLFNTPIKSFDSSNIESFDDCVVKNWGGVLKDNTSSVIIKGVNDSIAITSPYTASTPAFIYDNKLPLSSLAVESTITLRFNVAYSTKPITERGFIVRKSAANTINPQSWVFGVYYNTDKLVFGFANSNSNTVSSAIKTGDWNEVVIFSNPNTLNIDVYLNTSYIGSATRGTIDLSHVLNIFECNNTRNDSMVDHLKVYLGNPFNLVPNPSLGDKCHALPLREKSIKRYGGNDMYFDFKTSFVDINTNYITTIKDSIGSGLVLSGTSNPVLRKDYIEFVSQDSELYNTNVDLINSDFTISFDVKTLDAVQLSTKKCFLLIENTTNNVVFEISFAGSSNNTITISGGSIADTNIIIPHGWVNINFTYNKTVGKYGFFADGKYVLGGNLFTLTNSCSLHIGPHTWSSNTNKLKVRNLVISKKLLLNNIGYSLNQQAFIPQSNMIEKWKSSQWVDFNNINKSDIKVCLHSRTSLTKSGDNTTNWNDNITNYDYTGATGTITNTTGSGIVFSAASITTSGTTTVKTNDLNIEFYYKQNNYTTGGIIYLYNSAANNVRVRNNASGIELVVNDNIICGAETTLGVWCHVKIIMFDSIAYLFINGVLKSSGVLTTSNSFSCTPRIGYSHTSYLTGSLDSILIYGGVKFNPLSNKIITIGKKYLNPPRRNSF